MNHNSLRVLVVDDEPDTARSICTLLGMWGHESAIASDGASALAICPAYRPDLILLDLGLPWLDGYEVLRRLRHLPGGDEVPDRLRAEEAGADLFLVKPFDPVQLEALLVRTADLIRHARDNCLRARQLLGETQRLAAGLSQATARSQDTLARVKRRSVVREPRKQNGSYGQAGLG
jgi:DNA-binding response OmpR family regulator